MVHVCGVCHLYPRGEGPRKGGSVFIPRLHLTISLAQRSPDGSVQPSSLRLSRIYYPTSNRVSPLHMPLGNCGSVGS